MGSLNHCGIHIHPFILKDSRGSCKSLREGHNFQFCCFLLYIQPRHHVTEGVKAWKKNEHPCSLGQRASFSSTEISRQPRLCWMKSKI